VIDANRCLAWLLQRPGIFPREQRIALGDRIYGCDDCQEVCPPNVRFATSRAACAAAAEPAAWVHLLELLHADDETLIARHGRWYLHDREVRWLRRNALIVLGNVADGGDPIVGAALVTHLAHADPMLRAHAVWAAARLARHDLLPDHDPDPLVTAELLDLPAPRLHLP
jgi:epoxyqueuosine reductase